MKRSLIIAVILIACLVVGFVKYQDIFSALVPVNPEISSFDLVDESALFDYSITAKGWVSNSGGAGDVVVTAIVNQGSDAYQKDQRIHLEANEGAEFKIFFNEVGLFDGTPEGRVYVKPVGSLRRVPKT